MPWKPFSKEAKTNSDSFTADNPEKKKLIVIVVVSAILIVGLPVLLVIKNRPDAYTRSATEAAKKFTPNAKVKQVKVAGGFAIATVTDPTSDGQIYAGNMTIFKVNEDGSMTQIASGSAFSPLDLLELGIPFATQAELLGSNINEVMQNLAAACGFNGGDAPGYGGFGASFEPEKWQIDSGTFDDLRQVLTASISNKNAETNSDDKVICVLATKNNSNATTDLNTYISTFTLELQFITRSGAVSTHPLSFSIGPKQFREYTLDGQKLPYNPSKNYF